MYKRTPFRDRAIDAMKGKEPQSTMSTDGENVGGPLFPKLREKIRQRREERQRGLGGKDTESTGRTFEEYIEEGGATKSRPENQVANQPLNRAQRRALKRRKKGGGATGLDIMNLYK